MASDAWQVRRQMKLDEVGHRCQLCNAPAPLEVHHRTYERLGHEHPMDLTVLCATCHERYHRVEPERPTDSGETLLEAQARLLAKRRALGVPC